MDQRGLAVKDLEPMIGRRSRVYEVLSRKRPLTLAMIWKLHRGLGIPLMLSDQALAQRLAVSGALARFTRTVALSSRSRRPGVE